MHCFSNIPYSSLHFFTHHVTSPTELELTTGLIVPLPSDSTHHLSPSLSILFFLSSLPGTVAS